MRGKNPQLWALPWLLLALVVSFAFDRENALGLKALAVKIGREGNNGALVLGLGTLLWLAWRAKEKLVARRIVLVMLLETATYGLIKLLTWGVNYQHHTYGLGLLPRPSSGDGGFPSGHTAAHVCLAYLLTERFPKLAPLWWAWAGLMGWSRVEAGAHWAYQIAAGMVLGLAVAYLFHRVPSPRAISPTAPPPGRWPEAG